LGLALAVFVISFRFLVEPCRKQHMTVPFLTVCILRLWRAHLDLPTLLKNYSLAFKAASVLLPPSDAIEMELSRALQVLPSPKYIKPESRRKQKREYESIGKCSGGKHGLSQEGMSEVQ
jgi:hypothetical protein